MNTITLDRLLPHVFAQVPDLHSEVWQQTLTLEKGKKYLVEVLGRRTTLDGTKLWED